MTTPNVIGALYEKIRRLNQRKTSLTVEYNARCAEIDCELATLQSALQTANDAVKDILCPYCKGTGDESYTDAAGSRDSRKCSHCSGTGIKKG